MKNLFKEFKQMLKEEEGISLILIVLFLLTVNLILIYVRVGSWEGITAFYEGIGVESAKAYINSFGLLSPLVFLLLQLLQVIIAPLPGHIFSVVGGGLFGTLWGSILSVIGIFAGSLIAFKLAQLLGRPFVEEIADKEDLEFIDEFFHEKKGIIAFFIIRMIPLMSFDIISYGMGLTKMEFKIYAIGTFIGTIPTVLFLSFLGEVFIADPAMIILITIISLLSVFMLPVVWGHLKETHKLEKLKTLKKLIKIK